MQRHRRSYGHSHIPHQAVVHLCILPHIRLTPYRIHGTRLLDEPQALCIHAPPKPAMVLIALLQKIRHLHKIIRASRKLALIIYNSRCSIVSQNSWQCYCSHVAYIHQATSCLGLLQLPLCPRLATLSYFGLACW